jgi:hypothetical protein
VLKSLLKLAIYIIMYIIMKIGVAEEGRATTAIPRFIEGRERDFSGV